MERDAITYVDFQLLPLIVLYREVAERRRETGDDRPLEELYEVVVNSERKDSVCSDTEREVRIATPLPCQLKYKYLGYIQYVSPALVASCTCCKR